MVTTMEKKYSGKNSEDTGRTTLSKNMKKY